MPELRDVALKVRSKNAGPFWLTIDVFCGDAATFRRLAPQLTEAAVAARFGVPAQTMKRFALEDLAVIKLSLPRPEVQGAREDRDMHGAAAAELVADMHVE